MADLIDRQAAIDAFDCTNELIVGGAANAQNVVNYINKVVGKIKDLPSVQPEIVRCGQCKYAEVADAQDNQDGYTCRFHRGSIWFSGSYCSWAERRTDG